ncbi:zyxin [Nematolebias whitei]|uniref:zyxin n=1 Tax=Nematolebias whitei TaxID=451745 RepID=UPI001898DAAE|nr:zyxin [Nematolebias whitei]XP_037532131.1 zyxin [Nematolebias whitei]
MHKMEDSSSSKPCVVTSSLNFKVTTPSFYNQPKKFASVAPPKPKSLTPPTAPSPTPLGTAVIGRVGDLPPPPSSLCDDFPPPPPPLDDLPAPPPECHHPSSDAAPAFPAPPPLVDDLPLPAPPEESACPLACPPPPPPPPPPPLPVSSTSVPNAAGTPQRTMEKQTSFDKQLDSLTGLLSEMETRGPFNPKLPSQYSAAPTSRPSAPPTAPKPALSFLPPAEMGDRPPPAPWAEELKARTNRHSNNSSGPNAAPAVAPKSNFGAKGTTSSASLAQKINQNLNQTSVAPKSSPSIATSSFPPPPAAPPAPHAAAPLAPHAAAPLAPRAAAPPAPPAAAPPAPRAAASPVIPAAAPPVIPAAAPPAPPAASPPAPYNVAAPLAPNHVKTSPFGSHANANQNPSAAVPPPQPKMMAPPSSSFTQPMKTSPASTPSPPGPVPIPGGGAPLNMREVEELEQMTKDFIRNMDRQAPIITSPPTEVCGKCGEALSRTQPAVRAMEKLFHSNCFCCMSCHRPLQGMQFYDRDGSPQCEDCYISSLAVCSRCGERITDRVLKAVGQSFHTHCFRCSTCSCVLDGAPFITDDNNNPYCVQDYHRRFSPLCVSCNEPIVPAPGSEETVRVVALDKNFHLKCYRCEDCARPLSIEADENGCYPLDGRILCMKCHTKRATQAAH